MLFEATFNTASNLEKKSTFRFNTNKGLVSAIKSMPEQIRQANRGKFINDKLILNQKKDEALAKKYEIDSAKILGPEKTSRLSNLIIGSASKIAKKKNGIVSEFKKAIPEICKSLSDMINEEKKVVDMGIGTNGSKGKLTSTQIDNEAGINSLSRQSESSEYIECVNPLYSSEQLYEGDYQSNFKKNMKATLLTIVTFIVTMLLTNVIRIYLGGTPGGDFSTGWQKGLFTFFSSLLLAPIIEEPAKLIAIKGGYGKSFYFAFNFLEFGGYLVMFLMSGGTGLGIFILLRTVCAVFHAITMRIMGSGDRPSGAVGTTIKLAICILLHFAFNALFVKYAGMVGGMAASKIFMFAMGFFGAAFGIFKVFKRSNQSNI